MKGKFIGKTSMGFKHGQVYELKSEIKQILNSKHGYTIADIGGNPCLVASSMTCICLMDKNSSAWCPYQSLEALLKNWEFVQGDEKKC